MDTWHTALKRTPFHYHHYILCLPIKGWLGWAELSWPRRLTTVLIICKVRYGIVVLNIPADSLQVTLETICPAAHLIGVKHWSVEPITWLVNAKYNEAKAWFRSPFMSSGHESDWAYSITALGPTRAHQLKEKRSKHLQLTTRTKPVHEPDRINVLQLAVWRL